MVDAKQYRVVLAAVTACVLFQLTATVAAQETYPTKPISLVVPWPAGAGTDVVQRAAARLVEEQLGQSIVVLNKPGAAGVIGARDVENAAPDGYTLGGIASTVLLTQYTSPNPTDWEKYTPIATLTYDPAAIAVRADSPWKSLSEFVEHAKGQSGRVTVGNSGTGGLHHIFAVVLEEASAIKVQHIPFKGGAPLVIGAIGGQIDAASADTSALYSQVQSGKLRLLGVAAQSRHPMFPTVPTFAEQGIDVDIGVRRLVVAPKGTAPAIVSKLEGAYLKAVADPAFLKIKGGWVVDPKNAADTATAMESDDRQLKSIVDRRGLRVKRQ